MSPGNINCLLSSCSKNKCQESSQARPSRNESVPGVGYPSVHCGLTASRVRSRAHLLKSGEKMTRSIMQMNTFLLTLKHRNNVNVAYTLVLCSPCCDGRLCTRAFCTWVRSKADLKESGESL